MQRFCSAPAITATLCAVGFQEPKVGTLPPGPNGGPIEVIHTLLVEARLMQDGRVIFLFPRADQEPALFAKIDGKNVRAIGTDCKSLTADELRKRLAGPTAVVVVQGEFELPDPFFLKALHERTVIFVLPKEMFSPMAKASTERFAPGKPRP